MIREATNQEQRAASDQQHISHENKNNGPSISFSRDENILGKYHTNEENNFSSILDPPLMFTTGSPLPLSTLFQPHHHTQPPKPLCTTSPASARPVVSPPPSCEGHSAALCSPPPNSLSSLCSEPE